MIFRFVGIFVDVVSAVQAPVYDLSALLEEHGFGPAEYHISERYRVSVSSDPVHLTAQIAGHYLRDQI